MTRFSSGWRGRGGDAAVILLAITIVGWTLRATSRAAGAVELVPAEVSLGSLPEGEEREVRFTVANGGAVPSSVVVVPSCTCLTPDEGPLTVAAHSNASFGVRIRTERKPGFNVAHVQLADRGGKIVAQSRITFNAVRAWLFEPSVSFLRGGDGRCVATAFCLAAVPPRSLEADSGDPALRATVTRAGPRTWRLEVELVGRPKGGLVSIRIREPGAGGGEVVGVLTASVPATRVGEVRVSTVAEPAGVGRSRAWMLVDTEASCGARITGVRGPEAGRLEWTAESETTGAGSRVWVRLEYAIEAASRTVEVDVVVGRVQECLRVVLPELAGA